MAITQTDSAYRCPRCDGNMAVRNDSIGCTDCGFVPNHGSD